MKKNNLVIQEKKVVDDDKIIILFKKTNEFLWYSLLLVVVVIAVIEFIRISTKTNLTVDIIIILLLVILSFFLFTYNKIKIKIVKTIKGDIIVERLDTLMIKEFIIKASRNPFLYSKEIVDGNYGFKIKYNDDFADKLDELNLLPNYKRKLNPLFLSKDLLVEISKFLDIKITFEEKQINKLLN